MPHTVFAQVRAGMKAAIESAGGPKRVSEHYRTNGLSCNRMLYDLFWQANFDLRYDDTHPSYSDGQIEVNGVMQPRKARTRLVPHEPTYAAEMDKLLDSHILTAITKIGKEFGINYDKPAQLGDKVA